MIIIELTEKIVLQVLLDLLHTHYAQNKIKPFKNTFNPENKWMICSCI